MGRLIVIEGLDGAGKATQAALLTKALAKEGRQVLSVSFPNYDSESSALVKMYLAGAFGQRPDDVNAYAASTFYAVDRYASYKQQWQNFYQNGGTVVADRYTTSNAVHQCSKLPKEQWDEYLDWLFDLEYRRIGIPAPDRVVFLELPLKVSQRLLAERYHGDENKKDIHERNLSYLEHSHQAACYCAEKLGWVRLDCTRQGDLLPVEQIAQMVFKAVE